MAQRRRCLRLCTIPLRADPVQGMLANLLAFRVINDRFHSITQLSSVSPEVGPRQSSLRRILLTFYSPRMSVAASLGPRYVTLPICNTTAHLTLTFLALKLPIERPKCKPQGPQRLVPHQLTCLSFQPTQSMLWRSLLNPSKYNEITHIVIISRLRKPIISYTRAGTGIGQRG